MAIHPNDTLDPQPDHLSSLEEGELLEWLQASQSLPCFMAQITEHTSSATESSHPLVSHTESSAQPTSTSDPPLDFHVLQGPVESIGLGEPITNRHRGKGHSIPLPIDEQGKDKQGKEAVSEARSPSPPSLHLPRPSHQPKCPEPEFPFQELPPSWLHH